MICVKLRLRNQLTTAAKKKDFYFHFLIFIFILVILRSVTREGVVIFCLLSDDVQQDFDKDNLLVG